MASQDAQPPTGPIGPDHKTTQASGADGKRAAGASPAVRFASVNEEIAPDEAFQGLDSVPPSNNPPTCPGEQLKQISETLRGTHLQERRMSHFAFEPVSLPASRVPSQEDSSREPSRHNTNNSSGKPSPRQSPRVPAMHSPPITPSATRSREGDGLGKVAPPLQKVEAIHDPAAVTPQISPPRTSPSTTDAGDSRPASSGRATRESSQAESSTASSRHHRAAFSIGPDSNAASAPVSRAASPGPGRATPSTTYSIPITPTGDSNDPYAANRRPPQSKNLDAIDQRFKFSALNSKHRRSPSFNSNVPRSSRSAVDVSAQGDNKKHAATWGGGHKDPMFHMHNDSSSTLQTKQGSMSELKRFLKLGGSKVKRTASPTPSTKSGTKTPPHHRSPQLPFDDTHGLTSKYGKFGRVLGAGAGGSVRLMKRSSDNTTFAVKEFRTRHSYESEKEYAKKVTAEFCIGSTLHHGNIIETLDIVHEKGRWYEVMEYAPFDLFAIVMTGKMSREEVGCCFLQILSGVTYLHSMGLAHRDLKLDNVVVNEHGIMKIIDFGSATVFKYPFETGITLASGIVGSDPYLAPEVYDERRYDPQPADIWSLAIIFCCMSLRRFPWKMPRMTDNSYKLFASTPTPGTELTRFSNGVPSKSTTDLGTPERAIIPDNSTASTRTERLMASGTTEGEKKPEVIKGPWRLLRLLPRESRLIISRMLEIDPKKRATMAEVLEDPWVSETVICRQEEQGQVYNAIGHTHTLEPPSSAPAPPAAK